MESFFAGLVGFLVGRGVAPSDAASIVKALERYLGFEPPVGLTGYVLSDMAVGEKKKTNVVVRGKTYGAHALEAILKYQQVAVLSKTGDYLDVAPSLTLWQNINELSLVDVITKVVEVTTLKTLEKLIELTLLKKIEQINPSGTENVRIDRIFNIDLIKRIDQVTDVNVRSTTFLRNVGFELGDFTFWGNTDYVSISTVEKYSGDYGVKNSWSGSAAAADLWQYVIGFPVSDFVELYVWAKNVIGSDAKIKVFWYYDDATTTSESIGLTAGWKKYRSVPASKGKRVIGFGVCNDSSVGVTGDIFYDDFLLIELPHTKVLLREDIISKGDIVSPNGAGACLIEGIAGKKIKVYDAEYEAGVDGLHCFYFGTSTALTSKQFLCASTKGKNSKTFVQPGVGGVGEGLYLYSINAETNMPCDFGYVLE